MSDVRCRACGAVVAPNASWCSLCYADLRQPVASPASATPASEPPAPGVVAAAARAEIAVAPTAAAAMRATVTAVAADVLDAATPLPVDADRPVDAAKVAPTWPCPRCGAKVAMDLDACDSCGAGFLSGASATSRSVALPVVGDLTRMSSGQRMLVAIGVAIGICVLLVLLAEVFGHVL